MLKKFMATLPMIFILMINISLTHAAMNPTTEPEYQKAVYHVGTKEGEVSTIETLKVSLDNIGVHIQKNHQGKPDLSIILVFHGGHIQWLKKNLIDEELLFMVNWFKGNHVEIKICGPGLNQQELTLADLVDGLKLYNH